MANATGPAVATWVRSCLDHALTERISLLLEGTFRDADVVSATVRRFAEAGYRTQIVVLAVRPERSRLDCLLRYASTGADSRWTPPSAHDTSFARLPQTVRALQDVDELHSIEVRNRAGVVFADERGPDGRWRLPHPAYEAVRAEHARPLDPSQAREWLDQYERLIAAADKRSSIDARELAAYRALLADADRIAPMAATGPADPAHARSAELQDRAAATVRPHGMPGARPPAARALPPPAGADPAARLRSPASEAPAAGTAYGRGRG